MCIRDRSKGPEKKTFSVAVNANGGGKISASASSVTAVSYTHLDVYKRQAVHDVNASRTHAELRFEPQGVWTITDLGSTNGTLVNGREVATQPLSEATASLSA